MIKLAPKVKNCLLFLSLLSLDNDKIMDMSKSDENTFKIFIDKVVKKVFDENVKIDKSLKPDVSVLDLFVFPELQNQASIIEIWIPRILKKSLFLNYPESMDEYETLLKKVKEMGFKYETMLLLLFKIFISGYSNIII